MGKHGTGDRQSAFIVNGTAEHFRCGECNIHVVHIHRSAGDQHRTAVISGRSKHTAPESHVAHFHRAAGDLKESVIGNSISGIAVDHTESCIQFLCCETCRIAAALCCRVDIQCRFQRVFHLDRDFIACAECTVNSDLAGAAGDFNGIVQNNGIGRVVPEIRCREGDVIDTIFICGRVAALSKGDRFAQRCHAVVGILHIQRGIDCQACHFFCCDRADGGGSDHIQACTPVLILVIDRGLCKEFLCGKCDFVDFLIRSDLRIDFYRTIFRDLAEVPPRTVVCIIFCIDNRAVTITDPVGPVVIEPGTLTVAFQ